MPEVTEEEEEEEFGVRTDLLGQCAQEDGWPGESDWWWMASGRTEVFLLSAGVDVGMSVSVLVGHCRKK